jgi:hypothetical protein
MMERKLFSVSRVLLSLVIYPISRTCTYPLSQSVFAYPLCYCLSAYCPLSLSTNTPQHTILPCTAHHRPSRPHRARPSTPDPPARPLTNHGHCTADCGHGALPAAGCSLDQADAHPHAHGTGRDGTDGRPWAVGSPHSHDICMVCRPLPLPLLLHSHAAAADARTRPQRTVG